MPRVCNAQTTQFDQIEIVWDIVILDPINSDKTGLLSKMNEAIALCLERKYSEALGILDSLTKTGFNTAKLHSNKGSVYFEVNQFERALQEYRLAIQLDSINSIYRYNLGLLHQELSNTDSAVFYYSKALELQPSHFPSAYKLGSYYSYVNINDFKALDILNSFIMLSPLSRENAEIYFIRGIVLNRIGNSEKSILDFNKVIELDSTQSDYFYNRGLAYYRIKNYSLSIKDYTKALSLNPKDGRINYNRAIAYSDLGQFDKAILDYDTDIVKNGETARAYNNRGRCYMLLDNFDSALSDFQYALKLEPNRPLTIFNLGILYGRSGNFDEACKYFGQAKDLGYPNTQLFDQYCTK